jgi:phytoene synthase
MSTVNLSSREIIAAGSKSFAAAAKLFSRDIREDVYFLYAWCRHCDDEIDGQSLGFGNEQLSPAEQRQRLERIQEMTRAALAGSPVEDPVFQGLQQVAMRHDIPAQYPLELVEGFVMDVERRRYFTVEDTLLYCYHVAGVVGIMMAYIMGVRDQAVLKRAADLGIAFQLTNIARDVMDDAANDRIYLPENWLTNAGVPVAAIAESEHRDGVFTVVKKLLGVADRYYASAREGIQDLPLSCAWAISAADRVYHNIGEIVLDRGAKAWDERAVAPAYRKIYWVMRSGFTALRVVSLQKKRVTIPRESSLWIKPDPS